MVLGVDEACTNIIRYAYRLRDDQLIALSMEGLRKCVRMRLRDYGEQVTPHEMKGRSHDMIKPGGLGLYLIRNAFDEVDYLLKRREPVRERIRVEFLKLLRQQCSKLV